MKIILLFVISILLLSCNQKQFDSKEALLEYLQNEENGYIQKKSVNGVDFRLMYRPTDLIVSQMLMPKSADKLDSLHNVYKNYLYFNLSISKNNKEILNDFARNKNEYGSIVNQLAFGMAEEIHLYTDKKDTIPLTDYIYPRMYGASGSTSILFVFKKQNVLIKEANFLIFTIDDMGMQTGEIKFKIKKNILIDQPLMIKNL